MKNSKNHITPPRLAEKLLLWFIKNELAEEVLGDLDEKFYSTAEKYSTRKARRNYWYQVINYLRPFAFRLFKNKNSNNNAMFKHNFKISYRQLLKNKGYSFINIGGLAMGMVVAMLIGLWVQDELNFNKYHKNYDQIAQVLRAESDGEGGISVSNSVTTGMGTLIRESFPDQIENLFMVRSRTQAPVVGNGELKFREIGIFLQPEGPEVLGLKMIYGTTRGLKEQRSIILSESLSEKLFGKENPVGLNVQLNASIDLLVGGVYKDLPKNSKFSNATFFSRLSLLLGETTEAFNVWNNYNIDIYVKLAENVDQNHLSSLIADKVKDHYNDWAKESGQTLFLHPMKDWHLRSEWKDGRNVLSKEMKFVRLYGVIGVFVLLLACINFMNLSTARSEKRAKEVGIRKTLGSLRKQLISQFYIESFLYTLAAFLISILLLRTLLPWFNETSGKAIAAPWGISGFWLLGVGFMFFTALVAGSYPAVYLSSFKPLIALKGGFTFGKNASIPRKILVVFQFTISIALIIGTITVNNQIQAAKDRPIGYSPKGMVSLAPASPKFQDQKELLKNEILNTGMAKAIGFSDYSVTSTRGWNGGFTWEDMDPSYDKSFNTIAISNGYADAVGLEFIVGRDFNPNLKTDKNSIIINESALNEMKLKNPVGTVIRYDPGWKPAMNYTIIGVVKDMIKGSPFQETDQSIMFLDQEYTSYMYIRLNPNVSASQSLPAIEKVYKEILPEAPFDYHFADNDYNRKFDAELRIGSLASFFTLLAILISCLGLFGLSAFVAEQRTKEIGIRKVLGASVLNLWRLLSKDFALLVIISCFIAIPVSYNVLQGWLDGYEVKTQLYWWVYATAGAGALLVTIVTVSFQAIRAAVANPVNSLRSE
ncbi:ABC transporter permease [Roseivirga sp.]|uniref:ABC transporter permease n=1 Tax=Roseivirga sp. TaxID=1964215 RepID=UPI002B267B56|nr:ABC transporter permease [Roseivirga sp.]